MKKGPKIVIATILGVVILYGSFFFGYKYQPDMSSKTLDQTVASYASESVVDDVLGLDSLKESTVTMNNIETYLELSDTMEGLKLSKYNTGLNAVDVSNMTLEDVQLLIKEFNELRDKVDLKTPTRETQRFYEVVGLLSSYESTMNATFIRENIDDINAYTEGVIKGITIDSLGVDFVTIDHLYTNLTDTDKQFKVTYIDPTSGKRFDLNIGWLTNLNTLVDDVKELNGKIHPVPDSKGNVKEYSDEEIESLAKKVINDLKIAQAYGYTAQNGKIKQEGNNYTKGFLF